MGSSLAFDIGLTNENTGRLYLSNNKCASGI